MAPEDRCMAEAANTPSVTAEQQRDDGHPAARDVCAVGLGCAGATLGVSNGGSNKRVGKKGPEVQRGKSLKHLAGS